MAKSKSTRICSVDGCESTAQGLKEFCGKHYKRLWRHGNLQGKGTPRGAALEFVRKAAEYTGDGCLLWPYATTLGYGAVLWDGKQTTAHRAVLAVVTSENPPKLEAAHKADVCHNRLCCNPAHLRWATVKENNSDKLIDGTHNRGEKHNNSKLKEVDVREIRRRVKAGEPYESISSSFGITASHVGMIAAGRSWVWLE